MKQTHPISRLKGQVDRKEGEEDMKNQRVPFAIKRRGGTTPHWRSRGFQAVKF